MFSYELSTSAYFSFYANISGKFDSCQRHEFIWGLSSNCKTQVEPIKQVEMVARLTITKEGSRRNQDMETDGETHRAGEENYAKNDSELREPQWP